MSQIEVLDPEIHGDLKIRNDPGVQVGGDVHMVPVLAAELGRLAVEVPICLVKNPETGQFGLFAILGFRAGENLQIGSDKSWGHHYVPLDVRRQPFVVAQGAGVGRGVMALDVDHPRVSRSEGDPIFDREGNGTDVLNHYRSLLSRIIAGIAPTEALLASLCDLDLVVPGRIEVAGDDGSFVLEGFYTIDAKALQNLDAQSLGKLGQDGSIHAVHLMVASMANVEKLLAKRNLRQLDQSGQSDLIIPSQ